MAQPTNTPAKRSDAAIESDIQRMMYRYPPLVNDRHRIDYAVQDGVITVSGYAKAKPTYMYARTQLAQMPGVHRVDASEFYCDEDIRRDVGHEVPVGMQVVVEYGAVVLTGRLPEGASAEDVVRQVGRVPGVHRVLTSFATS